MLYNMMIGNMHPKSQPEEQIRQTTVVQSNLSTTILHVLSKSEVKKTTSDILFVSTDAFGRSFSNTVVVFDTSSLLSWSCSQQSGGNISYLQQYYDTFISILNMDKNPSIVKSIWNLVLPP